MTFRWAAVAAIVLFAGCAAFDPYAADNFKPGVTTLDQAIEVLGPYKAESAAANGQHLYQWMDIKAFGSAGHLALLFDEQNRYVKMTHRYVP